jgi:Ser/Thr protein kinase RdoA (MazF antagonist)
MLIPRPGKLYHLIAVKTTPSRIDEAELRQVLRAYDLGELKGYSQPAIGATRSQNLILETTQGKKAFKQYKRTLSLEGIIYEHSVLRHLALAEFPGPRLVSNRNDETYTELDGNYYVVTDFIAGSKYIDFYVSKRKKKQHIQQAAQTLARYHQLIADFVPDGKKTDGFMPDGQKRWHDSEWYLAEFDRCGSLLKANGPVETELEYFFLNNITKFKQELVNTSRKFEENDRFMPKLVIHGDYGPYNLLFDRNQLTAVLDFECVHLDWRADEVISAIYRFAGTKRGIDYELGRIFLSAYQSICPLTPDEIALMPDIFRFSRLRNATMALSEYFELASPARLSGAWHMIWWLEWMGQNATGLMEAMLEDKPISLSSR